MNISMRKRSNEIFKKSRVEVVIIKISKGTRRNNLTESDQQLFFSHVVGAYQIMLCHKLVSSMNSVQQANVILKEWAQQQHD